MLKRYIGDKAFYRRVLAVALPIIIQNGITNFVSLLDNIMVGQVGTVPMSGVAIVNQLMFVFNLCIFGATSGAGIFTAQFFGSRDRDGMRHTFRFKVLIGILLSVLGIGVFLLAGTPLIQVYLNGEGDLTNAAQSLAYGKDYLDVMLWGLVPFALANAYASTLRETNKTMVPMVAGIAAVLVNLCLNYVLIFGHFGAPAMGVTGAAVATVISRYVELAIVAGWTHLNRQKNPYIVGAYRSLFIPGKLLRQIILKGMPLLINEALWSVGMAFINQCYSIRALAAEMICISALMMPFNAYTNAAYFTLRSGGQTLVTFVFDSCFVWAFVVPIAFCLSRFTGIPIIPMYFICQGTDLVKSAIGAYMIHKGRWIRNLVQ